MLWCLLPWWAHSSGCCAHLRHGPVKPLLLVSNEDNEGHAGHKDSKNSKNNGTTKFINIVLILLLILLLLYSYYLYYSLLAISTNLRCKDQPHRRGQTDPSVPDGDPQLYGLHAGSLEYLSLVASRE